MSEQLSTVLDKALARLEAGEPLEAVLIDYPSQRNELAPLLLAAWKLSSIRAVALPAEIETGLMGFLEEARVLRPGADSKSRLRTWLADRRAGLEQLWWRPSVRLCVGSLAALVLMLCLLGGLLNLAGGSLPGELLYPFKLTGEEVRLAFSYNQLDRAEYHLTRAQTRAEEIYRLVQAGRFVHEGTVARLDQSLEASLRAAAEVNPAEISRLLARIEAMTADQEAKLSAAEAAAKTAGVRQLLSRARQGLARARYLAQAGRGDVFGFSLDAKYGVTGIGLPSPAALGVDEPTPTPGR